MYLRVGTHFLLWSSEAFGNSVKTMGPVCDIFCDVRYGTSHDTNQWMDVYRAIASGVFMHACLYKHIKKKNRHLVRAPSIRVHLSSQRYDMNLNVIIEVWYYAMIQ